MSLWVIERNLALTVHRSVSKMAYMRQMVVVFCVVSVGLMALLLYRIQTLNSQLSSGFLRLWNEVNQGKT